MKRIAVLAHDDQSFLRDARYVNDAQQRMILLHLDMRVLALIQLVGNQAIEEPELLRSYLEKLHDGMRHIAESILAADALVMYYGTPSPLTDAGLFRLAKLVLPENLLFLVCQHEESVKRRRIREFFPQAKIESVDCQRKGTIVTRAEFMASVKTANVF